MRSTQNAVTKAVRVMVKGAQVGALLLLTIVFHLCTVHGYYREGFFNGTSSVRLSQPISLYGHTGLSFRTCVGGELLSQGNNDYSVTLEVNSDGLLFVVVVGVRRYENRIDAHLIDNEWYNVNVVYTMGVLTLAVNGQQEMIANTTYNTGIFADFNNSSPVLTVGNGFKGCILEGPGVVFNSSVIQSYNVLWGPCPLNESSCNVDYCYNEPCMQHGKCISRPDRYECKCSARYMGKNCEIDNGPPCSRNGTNPCHNNGQCEEDSSGNYFCMCTPLYTGKNCETEISALLCESNPCENGGSCHVSANGEKYECSCLSGFMGQDCEINVNECVSNPCQHGGTCLDGVDSYICHCERTGYSGMNCEANINECESNPCMNGGICFDNYGGYTCQCTGGYRGQNCEVSLDECASSPCQYGGVCIDKGGYYECHCRPGYSGINCEVNINECEGVTCPPNSMCVDGINMYHCVCKSGYPGIPPNCTELNLCEENSCLNGGTCINTGGYYNCSCMPGYTGARCEKSIDWCIPSPCKNGGTCTGSADNYSCACPEFFTGPTCERQIKCDDSPCQHATSCQDYPGGFYCKCEPGWMGTNCDLDVSECQSDPCRNGGNCTDLINAFSCQCPLGFEGTICEINIDECLSNPCQNGGACVDLVNGYSCNCSSDFMGDNCESEYNICSFSPCLNNGTCVKKATKGEYYCECSPGFEGLNCENNINDCLRVTCADKKQCVDGVNGYECLCPKGYTGDNCSIDIDYCLENPCQNNGTCRDGEGSYSCICPPGFTGVNCESDIDECNITRELCNYGICQNEIGSYQCFCRPGFSGDHCDLDFDECLSRPCLNGAECKNEINGYSCDCQPGYAGKDCSININECESNPCMNNATCIDQINNFKCVCPPGLAGDLCEINIDDCESSPCQNGGICFDGINSYTCNCSDTGYNGTHCEVNIDDCESMPCEHGGECIDKIKLYECECYNGYSGENCEHDINECDSSPCQYGGTCLEKSNGSLYSLGYFGSDKFNYANAAGYKCLCVVGITGTNCEININECESSPCRFGMCKDKINSYVCECEEGYEGEHCEIEINECERFMPCVHGECIDKRANYFCDCEPNYGGKNCSVELIGCRNNTCENGGTCTPYLENEMDHKFNCSCRNGFFGQICEKITTMSLNGSSYIAVNTSRDEGYELQFRFKTTLPSGLLAYGQGQTFYVLELVNGKLNLHSSLLNKWDGVFIGSELNNSQWQKVFVNINTSHLVLAANEEQTIYPITILEGNNASSTSFNRTYLGGNASSLGQLVHGPHSFVGCMEDVVINGNWVVPQASPGVDKHTVHVEVGCPRTPQCEPNPCHSGGHCIDQWQNFSCSCERPYLGHTCQYNLTAATFGHENTTDSFATVLVNEEARRAVRSILDISMFIRTRKGTGTILYLGSMPDSVSFQDETLIEAELEAGELLVHLQFNATPEKYPVSGVKLDDGYNHLIQVVRNVTLVQVKINGTEYFRKTISASGQLNVEVLYLGGMPHGNPRLLRQVDDMERTAETALGRNYFKGIIQDVQITNGSHVMVVEFFKLDVQDLELPQSFGNVSFAEGSILKGVVSDNTCVSNPCFHNGSCVVTWNDFECKCPRGYKGKICDEMEFCQLQECPAGSRCHNLENGFECIANATFNGMNSSLHYALSPDSKTLMDSLEVTYRSMTGGTVLYISKDSSFFAISVHSDQVTVSWKFENEESVSFKKDEPDGEWSTVIVQFENGIRGGFKNKDIAFSNNSFSYETWRALLDGNIIVGSGDSDFSTGKQTSYSFESGITDSGITNFNLEGNDVDIHGAEHLHTDHYKGCLGEIRIGNLLLPFFSQDKLGTTNHTRDYFYMIAEVNNYVDIQCILCFDYECQNNGSCQDPTNTYQCTCLSGFEGQFCSININECQGNICQNNATCIDGIANYTCKCELGWEGWLCDTEIDECASSPCQNGGTCHDELGRFECVCPEEYTGEKCDMLKIVTCENKPCKKDSICEDTPDPSNGNNFTCICSEGFEGTYCDIPFCNHSGICENDGFCNTSQPVPFCQCAIGFKGRSCETNINDCAYEKIPLCKNEGMCIDHVGYHRCDCSGTGFTGESCEIDVDECLHKPCYNEAECENLEGSYKCHCPSPYCGKNCDMLSICEKENPCQHGGTCRSKCEDVPDYECICTGHSGKNCTEPPQQAATDPVEIVIIVAPILAGMLIIAGITLTVFVMMARKKRATRGTYSPSQQEYCNPRVELDNVMKPPPEERLI